MKQSQVFYLEMCSPDELNAVTDNKGMVILEAQVPDFQLNRHLYQAVGAAWQWKDKLSMTDEEWQEYANDPNLRTYVGYVKGTIAGYYELQMQDGGDVEIRYFGLTPDFIGKGLGGFLLSQALRSAWELPNTKRVWVHTCDMDHPGALSNYKARGMRHYKTETETLSEAYHE
ncbi:GNAT family N-acetyltransferase [Paraferrimonas sedimenticola]|uniref:N-acetyltransferase n=1 Tax=Paraferrimonas sedimenticola TaxID=375674 RepID=A0AA37W080_9GAMM|nr:GNAT family N-acetyltransferase [Paraferrimonas sedimenticola]GLP95113.1 N-acetyltransferase [Paraferrimonas sedimenticola]